MKILVIGLGSMGRRRIRCLKALGENDIWGYDELPSAANDVYCEYEINVCYRRKDLRAWLKDSDKFDAMLVCTPPLAKAYYIQLANAAGIPCFCEADLCVYDGEYYPSNTMIYHPAIQAIHKILEDDALGRIFTFNYHMGQHIYDWHPGADYKMFYAAQAETGACREMFAFELSWLSYLFGEPCDTVGFVNKRLNDEQVKADDVYSAAVAFRKLVFVANSFMLEPTVTGTVLVDILSRPAIRRLCIIGEKAVLTWDWNNHFIHIAFAKIDASQEVEIRPKVDIVRFVPGEAAKGYNENIPEQMYVEELKAFLHDAAQQETNGLFIPQYKYGRAQERAVIKMLSRIEEFRGGARRLS